MGSSQSVHTDIHPKQEESYFSNESIARSDEPCPDHLNEEKELAFNEMLFDKFVGISDSSISTMQDIRRRFNEQDAQNVHPKIILNLPPQISENTIEYYCSFLCQISRNKLKDSTEHLSGISRSN